MNLRKATTAISLSAALVFGPGKVSAKSRLADENSPHLRDHAATLVDWYPWGEEAFEKARTEKKPIFLSIGYHSCHWCHKMKVETFNNPELAGMLNEHFVNIKVDREEFPDVDRIYLAYLQVSQGSGGWPLNVWLTADLVPFSVGTYFPPESTGNKPSFHKAITHIISQWNRFPDYIDTQSKRDFTSLRAKIQDLPESDPTLSRPPDAQVLASYERLAKEFDPEHGGFGSSPRFLDPAKIDTARYILQREPPDSFRARQCRRMVTLTLDKMAAGGIYDQLGGGFHRYASDSSWSIPHFEKMLADQALMLSTFTDAFRLTGDPAYLAVMGSIHGYVEATLKSPQGAYFVAQHSDSPATSGDARLVEGAYYTWDAAEFSNAAGRDAALLAYHFDVRPGGNAPLGAVASPTLSETNILRVEKGIEQVATKFGISATEAAAAIARGKGALLAARKERPAPAVDQLIVVSDNSLMVSALANAFTATGDRRFLEDAQRVLTFIRSSCFKSGPQKLFRTFDESGLEQEANAEDYANTIQACLDLYAAGFDQQWLRFAETLQKIQIRQFFDQRDGGFYNTARSRNDIVIRLKSFEDGAELSPNSVSILNLARLGNLLGIEKFSSMARQSIACFRGALDRFPALSHRLLLAEAMLADTSLQIVICGRLGSPDTAALIAAARAAHGNSHPIALIDRGARETFLLDRNPLLAQYRTKGGKATAFVCEDYSCKEPTSDPLVLGTLLQSAR